MHIHSECKFALTRMGRRIAVQPQVYIQNGIKRSNTWEVLFKNSPLALNFLCPSTLICLCPYKQEPVRIIVTQKSSRQGCLSTFFSTSNFFSWPDQYSPKCDMQFANQYFLWTDNKFQIKGFINIYTELGGTNNRGSLLPEQFHQHSGGQMGQTLCQSAWSLQTLKPLC